MGALFFFETDLEVAFGLRSGPCWTGMDFSPPTYLSRSTKL